MAVGSSTTESEVVTRCPCANWQDEGPVCTGPGLIPCPACELVSYCSFDCMNIHETRHMHDCHHGVARRNWIPKWYAEGRVPDFIKEGETVPPFIRRVPRAFYYWGNLPAADMLGIPFNEGEDTRRKLKVLTVEGDIRHGVQTIAMLPDYFAGTVAFTVSHGGMDHAARNIILVMLAFLVPSKSTAVECMIHVWYSAYLTPEHARVMTEHVRPVVAEAARLASEQDDRDAAYVRDLTVEGGRGVRISLTPAEWEQLLTYFDFPPEDDENEPDSVLARDEIMTDESFNDERDLILARNPGHRRVSIMKFWQDGVLQPFGQRCTDFTIPNPILFRDTQWTVEELADPFDGWDVSTALTYASHMPQCDMYGRLYCYLEQIFTAFVRKAHRHTVTFEMHRLGPHSLYENLDRGSFSRIDVTTVTEHPQITPAKVYEKYGPLLEHPDDNPHATMIGMYVQGIEDEFLEHEELGPNDAQFAAVRSLLQLDPTTMSAPYCLETVRCSDALPLVLDFDEAFTQWKRSFKYDDQLSGFNLKLKDRNTIVKPWPTRIQALDDPSTDVMRAAFALAVSSPHGGSERVVEIQRVDPNEDIVMD